MIRTAACGFAAFTAALGSFQAARSLKECCAAAVQSREESKPAASAWQSVVYAFRDKDTKMCALKANGDLLKQSGRPREFRLTGLWRYDPDKGVWNKVALPVGDPILLKPVAARIHANAADQTIVDLTDRIGLYWAEWREDGYRASTLVYSGPVACNDLRIGTPPKGSIAACVSSPDSGRATFVPDPEGHCRQGAAAP